MFIYNNSERTHIFVLLTVFIKTNDTYHYGFVRSNIFLCFKKRVRRVRKKMSILEKWLRNGFKWYKQ